MLDQVRGLSKLISSPNRRSLQKLFVLILIGAILEIVSVAVIPLFVLAIANRADFNQVLNDYLDVSIVDLSVLEVIAGGSIIVIVIFFLKAGYLAMVLVLQQGLLYKVMRELSSKLYRDYLMLPYAVHVRRNSSEQIRNLKRTIPVLILGVLNPLMSVITAFVLMLGLMTFLLIQQPLVFLIVVGTLGLGSGLFLFITNKRLYNYGVVSQDEERKSIALVQEGLASFIEIRLLDKVDVFTKSMKLSLAGQTDAARRSAIVSGLVSPGLELLAVLTLLIVINVIYSFELPAEELLSIVSLMVVSLVRVRALLSQVTSNWSKYQYNSPTIFLLNEEFESIRSVSESSEHAVQAMPLAFNESVDFKAVSFSYADDAAPPAASNDLRIRKGETVVFIGPTGGGKTTCMNLLAGLLHPTQGSVNSDGIDIASNVRGWQENIAYVSQNVFLLDETIATNIAFGEKEINDELLQEALYVSDLEDFVSSLPNGKDTRVGERGAELSGGQRQRIAIARMVYAKRPLVLMDEATSALDNVTERRVVKRLLTLSKDTETTLVLISHRLGILEEFDTLHYFDSGKIRMSGSFDSLYTGREEFRAFVDGLQEQ